MDQSERFEPPNTVKIIYITTVDLSMRFLVFETLKYLKKRGYNIQGISAQGKYHSEVGAMGINLIPVPLSRRVTPFADLRSLLRLVNILRSERPDVVHTHTPKANLLGQCAARIANVPVRLCTIHGFYFTPHTPLLRRIVLQALEVASAFFAHRVFLVNQEDLQTARALPFINPSKLRFLRGGLGIDVARFDPAILDQAALASKRSQFGIPDNALVVGYVGRLVREKGLVELFRAFTAISKRFPNAWLLVVGPYDAAKQDSLTPDSARQYGATERVVFTGMRTDTADLYGLMDLFVLPSYREGMPGVAMEAQAMGLPVITTSARGCREAVLPGKTGLIVPLKNANALANALQLLLSNDSLRLRMGRAGRQFALSTFDQTTNFQLVEKEFLSLLNRLRIADCRLRIDLIPQSTIRNPQSKQAAIGPFYYRYGKRLFDLAFSAAALLLLSPLLAITAAIIRAKMGAPVLFRQQRPGHLGRPFVLLKFRTMTAATDEHGHLLPDKERIPPLGRLLRRTSLDELPQLLNVLKGDMSLVGPRPLLMQYLHRYTPEQLRRHDVRPGITGWAQVNGRNALTWEQKFDYDLWYVQNLSFPLDLRILLTTLAQIIKGTGTTHQGHATMPEFLGGDRR